VAINFLKRGDRVSAFYVIHVWDPKKVYLPTHLNPTHLEHEFTNALLMQHVENAGALPAALAAPAQSCSGKSFR
jgi:hypothetical protein